MSLPRLILVLAVLTVLGAAGAIGFVVFAKHGTMPEEVTVIDPGLYATPLATATPAASPSSVSSTASSGKVDVNAEITKLDSEIKGADGSDFKDSAFSESSLGL